MEIKLPELLAPAGSATCLNAAVSSGADAVYLGLENFNARIGADNFTHDTLKQACKYCHSRDVRVYLTINTLVITYELKPLLTIVEKSIEAGVDAFIIQDFGIASEISRVAGKEFVHISTQANIHNVDGVKFASAIGAGRITLAREVCFEEIENITKVAHELGIEIECFAHGAICVCYSGQCLMSSCVGARSANRGMCAQVCRMPYEIFSQDDKECKVCDKSRHLLSTKDLCTINDISKFIAAGVDSLKIEGRMKSSEYVSSVVKTYREVLDSAVTRTSANVCASGEQMKTLKSSFSRGFTNGYLYGNRSNDIMSYDRPNNRGVFVGRVKEKTIIGNNETKLKLDCETKLASGDLVSVWTKHGTTVIKIPKNLCESKRTCEFTTKENCKDIQKKDRVFRVREANSTFKPNFLTPKIPLQAKLKLKIGQNFEIYVKSKNEEVVVLGDVVESARTKSVSKEEVIAHFDRLGQTNFILEEISVDLDDGVGISFSKIHNLRNEALDELYSKISDTKKHNNIKLSVKNLESVEHKKQTQICVVVTNADDSRLVKKAGAIPYIPALCRIRGQAQKEGVLLENPTRATYPKDAVQMFPIVHHDLVEMSRENRLLSDSLKQMDTCRTVYCDDVSSIMRAKSNNLNFEVGQFVPVTNDLSIKMINELKPSVLWLSCELNLKQIEYVASKIECDLGLFVLGSQRLATCEHCVLMSRGACLEKCNVCRRRKKKHYLIDRLGYKFRVVSDNLGRSTIYNSVMLDLTPNLKDLVGCGINHFMIDATLMSSGEITSFISRVGEALKVSPKQRLKNSTSGHLFRGV